MDSSVLRKLCSTVVWSRPPKYRPISSSRSLPIFRARYTATPRAVTNARRRTGPRMSDNRIEKCRAVAKAISCRLGCRVRLRRSTYSRAASRSSRPSPRGSAIAASHNAPANSGAVPHKPSAKIRATGSGNSKSLDLAKCWSSAKRASGPGGDKGTTKPPHNRLCNAGKRPGSSVGAAEAVTTANRPSANNASSV